MACFQRSTTGTDHRRLETERGSWRSKRRQVARRAAAVWPLLISLCLTVPLLAADESGHGAEMSMAEQAQQFLKTSFWGLLVFVIVLSILWKKLFPPVVEALDRRARMIEESLAAAQKAKEDAEKMMAEHEANLEKARAEGRAIVEEARDDALKVKNGIVEDARRESEEITARSKREIVLAKQAAVDDLYRQAAQLSFDLAEKVIQKSLDPEDHQKLVEDCINEYRESSSR